MSAWPFCGDEPCPIFCSADLHDGHVIHGWALFWSCEPFTPVGRVLLARPGPACRCVFTPPAFLRPSLNFSTRLVPVLGFVPPAITSSIPYRPLTFNCGGARVAHIPLPSAKQCPTSTQSHWAVARKGDCGRRDYPDAVRFFGLECATTYGLHASERRLRRFDS